LRKANENEKLPERKVDRAERENAFQRVGPIIEKMDRD